MTICKNNEPNITINNTIEHIEQLKYQGSIKTHNASCNKDIQAKIAS